MAATHRFFPHIQLASPNGRGSKAAPAKPTEAKALRFAPGAFWPIDSLAHTVTAQPLAALEWYAVSWLAYACMRYRATKLMEPPLWVSQETDDGDEWVEGDHPLADLLELPNPDMEMSDLLEITSLYLDTTGACIWLKQRGGNGRVEALYPFSRAAYEVESADGKIFGKFRVRGSQGLRDYGPEDVVHFRNADPRDPHGSVAPLDAALKRLRIDTTLEDSIRASLQNAVVPGMTLTYPADAHMMEDQILEIKARLSSSYEGARNHGKPLVLGGGVSATQSALGFKGIEGGPLAAEIEAAVCACFQLPPVVIGANVGLQNSSDRHNLETSVGMVYDNAIIPAWTRIERAITRSLLREVDTNPLRFVRFDKARVKFLQSDVAKQSEVAERTSDVLTINERRVLMGYPPLDDAAVGDVIAARTTPAAAPAAKAYTPPTAAKAARRTRWTIHDAVTRAQEFAWEISAAAQLEADRAAILEIVRDRGKAATPLKAALLQQILARIAEYLDVKSAAQWRARVAPLLTATGTQAVERAAVELGISFDLLQPGLLDYVQKHSAELVTQVTATTKQAIREAVRIGLEEGAAIYPDPLLKVPSLVERIQQATAFNRTRSELIARTETTAATNGAAVDSLKAYAAEHGGTFRKEWLATLDSRVRDEHAAMDGETVGIDGLFSNGRSAPGEPNCRCATILTMED